MLFSNKYIWVTPLLLSSCGAGMFDFDYEIKNDYYFVYTDGRNKTISFRGEEGKGTNIDANVISYTTAFFNKYILVFRQPRVDFKERSSKPPGYIWSSYLEDKCEYWVINTESHERMGPYTEQGYLKIENEIGLDHSKFGECPVEK